MQSTAPPNHPPEPWRLRKGAKQSQGEWYSRGYLPHRDRAALIQHVTVHLADSLPGEAVERIDLSVRLLPEGLRRNERRSRLDDLIDAGHGSCILRIPALADIVQDTLLYFHDVRYSLHAWVVMPNHFHVLFEPANGWTMAKILSSWKKYTARRIRGFLRNASLEAVNFNADLEIGVPHGDGNPEATETFADLEIGDPHGADGLEAAEKFVGLGNGVPGGDFAGRSGRKRREYFWHREFWDRYIRDEEHYLDTVEYIHKNPVKAGLVKDPEDWPWSSAGRGRCKSRG